VVSFTPQQLYPRGKSPWYPLDRRLGGPPEPVWMTWRRENSWVYRDSNSNPLVIQPIAVHYTNYDIPTAEDVIKKTPFPNSDFQLINPQTQIWSACEQFFSNAGYNLYHVTPHIHSVIYIRCDLQSPRNNSESKLKLNSPNNCYWPLQSSSFWQLYTKLFFSTTSGSISGMNLLAQFSVCDVCCWTSSINPKCIHFSKMFKLGIEKHVPLAFNVTIYLRLMYY
jgi:hypothetical protein